ncbi:MAG: hypothetical protein JNM56_22885 [Planctomycetia bacterium]|nr:hypothetical protein [Planctomycetia bacterium]
MSAWQGRRHTQHLYYARRSYQDGRRRYEYLGRGPDALLAAEAAAQRWAEQQAAWQTARGERQQLSATSEPLAALEDGLDVLTKAVLFASGCRRFDGHWRPKRHANT